MVALKRLILPGLLVLACPAFAWAQGTGTGVIGVHSGDNGMIMSGDSGTIGSAGRSGGESWGSQQQAAGPDAVPGPGMPDPEKSPGMRQPNFTGGIEFVEWFGMNLGAGYVGSSYSFGQIDMHFFTLNWPGFYYTVFEASIFPFYGMSGVGGRMGVRLPMGDGEIRIGGRLGFKSWLNPDRSDYAGMETGMDLTPHVQFVRKLAHGTVGVGLDIPIMFGVSGAVAGGFQVYFRWSVF